METQIKQRMDGLVWKDSINRINDATREIISELKKDGFEDEDIYQYICDLVKEAGN